MKNPKLSVEELMKKIKAELAAAEDGRTTAKRSRRRPSSALLSQRLQESRVGLRSAEDQAIEFRDNYTLTELLRYEDALFIRNAYRSVLQREPEPGGADRYLQQLRNGSLPKIELIGGLRYSEEGKQQAVHIRGLRLRFNARKLFHLPGFGYLARWATACIRLPLLMRNFEQLHASVHYRLGDLGRDIETLSQRLGTAKLTADRRAEAAEKRLDAIEKMLVALRAEIQDEARRTAELNESKADKIDNSSLPEFWILDGNRQFLRHLTEEQGDARPLRHEDQFYSAFEDAFRDDEAVRLNQRRYLQFIKADVTVKQPFLDCGCGRGEFLETLAGAAIPAIGVDVNRHEIERLDQQGVTVKEADMLSWLQQSDQMYGGISALQVIEHLDSDYLMQFLNAAVSRLIPGGVMILETVNPHCPSALGNFYQDPTHVKPIPPELLQFLVTWNGLSDCKLTYSSLAPVSLRSFSEPRMNYQDYAVIGYKR